MHVTDKPRQTTGDEDNIKDSCVTSIKFAEKGYRHTLCMQMLPEHNAKWHGTAL